MTGNSPFQTCDNYGMGEETAAQCLRKFTTDMMRCFPEYLEPDFGLSLKASKKRGYKGLLGSLDCTHVAWHMCPRAYAAQHLGRSGEASLILEALVDSELRFVHYYFGVPGSSNDINVLMGSPLLTKFANGSYPSYRYKVGGQEFTKPYILTDGIYPRFSVFAKSIRKPSTEIDRRYAQWQEAVRKDVERAFGIIKKQWRFMSSPIIKKSKVLIGNMVATAIILHNMQVEDKQIKLIVSRDNVPVESQEFLVPARAAQQREYTAQRITSEMREENRARMRELQDVEEHERLKEALRNFTFSRN